MGQVVQVQLGDYGQVGFCDLNDVIAQRDDIVIIEIDRGCEFGRIMSDINAVCKTGTQATQGKILRKSSDGDLKQIENNRLKAKESLSTCVQKISEKKIQMELVKAEYSFDSSRIVVYFTAEDRVDFRNLVKDLAKIFRVRIELKQIGVRDKAKIVGGYGVCGRELCCSSFLNSFHALSIKMAKDQNLPLNPTRISGVCGRIKCCMAYEFQVYKEYAKGLPRAGDRINTPDGDGRVVDVNILRRYAYVQFEEGAMKKVPFSPIG